MTSGYPRLSSIVFRIPARRIGFVSDMGTIFTVHVECQDPKRSALSSYLWRVLIERPWAAPDAPGHTRREEEEREREKKKKRREIKELTTGHNCIVMLI